MSATAVSSSPIEVFAVCRPDIDSRQGAPNRRTSHRPRRHHSRWGHRHRAFTVLAASLTREDAAIACFKALMLQHSRGSRCAWPVPRKSNVSREGCTALLHIQRYTEPHTTGALSGFTEVGIAPRFANPGDRYNPSQIDEVGP